MTNNRNIDSHKLFFHPRRVAQSLNATESWELAKNSYPIFVEISPAAHCNSRCSFCALDFTEYKKAILDADMLKVRFREMATLGVLSLHLAGEGEPMLHPRISDIVDYATDAGIDVGFTSNGSRMDKVFVERSLSKTSWIKISLNGGDREAYSKVHKVKEHEFDRVIENIKYAVKYKKEHSLKCDIGIQSVLLPENAHTMEKLVLLAKEIGVTYVVIKPFSPHQSMLNKEYDTLDYAEYLQLSEALSKYNDENFEIVFRVRAMTKASSTYEKCLSTPYLWAYISTQGSLLSCSAHFEDPRFHLGNINQETFKEIWGGENRRKNYEMMKEFDLTNCRANCRMTSCNQYLDNILNNKIKNVNFI